MVSPTGYEGGLLAATMVEMPPHYSPAVSSPPDNTNISQSSPGIVHGSTPLSQIGANPCPPPSDMSLLQGMPVPYYL